MNVRTSNTSAPANAPLKENQVPQRAQNDGKQPEITKHATGDGFARTQMSERGVDAARGETGAKRPAGAGDAKPASGFITSSPAPVKRKLKADGQRKGATSAARASASTVGPSGDGTAQNVASAASSERGGSAPSDAESRKRLRSSRALAIVDDDTRTDKKVRAGGAVAAGSAAPAPAGAMRRAAAAFGSPSGVRRSVSMFSITPHKVQSLLRADGAPHEAHHGGRRGGALSRRRSFCVADETLSHSSQDVNLGLFSPGPSHLHAVLAASETLSDSTATSHTQSPSRQAHSEAAAMAAAAATMRQRATAQEDFVQRQREAAVAACVAEAEAEAAAMDAETDAEDSASESEFDPFLFIKFMPQPSREQLARRPMLPRMAAGDRRTTLVLDLDETLVHCSTEQLANHDLTFSVLFNAVEYKVYVRKRPGLAEFLECVSRAFEVVVFTASQEVYADKLLDIIDPERRYIHHRLFRDACVNVAGNYIKDLNICGRDLAKIAIVDNSPQVFGFQLDNGIPIVTWFEDPDDRELLRLLPFLDKLVTADDVRPLIREKFALHELVRDAT